MSDDSFIKSLDCIGQVKVALIATDFANSKVSTKEEDSENEYQKALMDMYYGIPNKKRQEVVEEVMEDMVVDEPVCEPKNDDVISEVPKKTVQKPTFLNRFLKALGDVVEKID